MADGNFTSLESIFQMITPADVLAAEKLGLGNDASREDSIVRKLQRLFLDAGNCGVLSADQLLSQLESFKQTKEGEDSGSSKKSLDTLVNVYTTAQPGKLDDVTYPYMYKGKDGQYQPDVTIDQIIGADAMATKGDKDLSLIVSKSPFITPMVRDAQKVGMFMNFLPTTVISMCVPYLELEFSFDRGFDKDLQKVLSTASLLKFLLGGVVVDAANAPDVAMFDSRSASDPNTQSSTSTAGMELFTAPQTLLNMDKTKAGSRYTSVLDPTRPFMSLEGVTINVTPTVGIMSYKKANVTIKLHDRSRLAEIADLVQPTTYTRTTVWLTYGWRHPYMPSQSPSTQTYADFINNNLMVREAYGVMNANFSFDSTGQVSIDLELYTKSVSELRDLKVTDDPAGFRVISNRIATLAQEIAQIRRDYKLDPPSGLNKEIRGYTILDAAEQGSFPDMNPAKILESIAALESSLKKTGKLPRNAVNTLIADLKELYAPDKPNSNQFDYKKRSETVAKNYVKKKFDELYNGADPFLPPDSGSTKMKALLSETLATVEHPVAKELEKYTGNADVLSPDLTKDGLKKCAVSFGKLFSVFMAPVIFTISGIDECQVFFYNLNDRCGPISSCNIAEFPIDLPVFMRQYREVIEAKGTTTMTVEQFVKLVVDTQINDQRAIGYGFRSAGVYKPWDPRGKEATYKDDKSSKTMDNLVTSVNQGRGSFVMPQVEVHIETTHAKYVDGQHVDILRYYEQSPATGGNSASRFGTLKRIVRIHVYDKTNNPYKTAGTLLRADSPNGTSYFEVDTSEWAKAHGASQEASTVLSNLNLTDKITAIQKQGDTGITVSGIQLTDHTDNEQIKHVVSKLVPTIVYGMNSSAILEASLSTKHDANLSAAQLLGLNAGKKPVATPAGAGVGGLPLKVIPASLSLRTIGCPLLNYSQLFFVDFNTGTTIDNIYGISGITHTFAPGKFESNCTMAFYDAYGKYEGAQVMAQVMKDGIKGIDV